MTDNVSTVYRTSPVKRVRRTKEQIATLDTVIYQVAEIDQPLTVRSIFYRVVSAGAVEKTEKSYNAVQRRVLAMRRTGTLPYSWIADGTRWQIKSATWGSVEDMLSAAAVGYRRALWLDQDVHVEVWSEKDALASVISGVTRDLDVPLLVARGFASETFLYSTAQQIIGTGKPAVIYQLGDHDPSGVAAWQHTQDRLRDFAPGVDLTFERLAVTSAQINTFNLPTRPTKQTDSRARNFTGESVEVDALPSPVLRRLVRVAVESWLDPHQFDLTRAAERSERELLTAIRGGVA